MENFSKLDHLLEKFAAQSVPGLSCAVMHKGKLVYSTAKGYADLEQKIPVQKDTIYRQASMTKLFTYAIAGMLYEEGEFLLTDPISNFLPEWKKSKRYECTENGDLREVVARPITIRDALSMTCGLPYCMVPNMNAENPTQRAMSRVMTELLKKGTPTLREEVRGMAEVPLAFEPGSHFLYGFGSEIVGAIVEEIEQCPLREVFHKRLIDPMELENTTTWIDEDVEKKLSRMFYKDPEGVYHQAGKEADNVMRKELTPAGARANLLTTAEDYVQFMYMLADGGTYKGKRFLGRKTIDLLHENQLNEAALRDFHCDYLAGYGYGLGFRTLMNKAEGGHNGSLGAFGWTGGAGTWAEADPEEKLAVVYMHNMAPNEELYHHLRVRAAVYGGL